VFGVPDDHEVPIPPAIVEQRARINTIAYEQGREAAT
jgi:hypothetical protein